MTGDAPKMVYFGPKMGKHDKFVNIPKWSKGVQKDTIFAPKGHSKVWRRCLWAKNHFLFEMVQKGPNGPKGVPNGQKHLGWPFWPFLTPFWTTLERWQACHVWPIWPLWRRRHIFVFLTERSYWLEFKASEQHFAWPFHGYPTVSSAPEYMRQIIGAHILDPLIWLVG